MQLVNCRLLNGVGGLFDFASIEIDKGRIWIDKNRANATLRRDTQDLQGQFVLPRLIDCHLLTADAGADLLAAVNSSEGCLAVLASRNAEQTRNRQAALLPVNEN